ncbi:dol-P-Glc:Glc(2)Man(9)GlcNAc(2)-PP-Dol alpha-1,2-glucosyltransferase isoform X2 [Carica papaya]|uniref:dol-P-Glc:Glc(2)Man(9)GlcNAc(2)-PP-Dol alpha-1,2-glucosyltransferase isoform X2 n=1 Tax=Carica papaya TaxID=3649 RepID=UPI000B8CFC64|nr:dol-P-Glc:Glc(2)Man(9)GlcNAc(2)-PP-Dol alpha-1,2-glucosyltransferase isoform X2 [Carica papaya]
MAITFAAVVILWVVPISILVNRTVPEPYMDEIFHVPQAQQYCQGNFSSWNPMITTPPGLYYLSLAYVATLFPGMFFLQAASSFSEACSPAMLRFTNSILVVLCSVLVFEIITHLRPVLSDKKATFIAVITAMYPLHWFFTFLYYTDVASLTAVLAMYLACLKKKYKFSALLGALAVFIRQTNIIWMLFVLCTKVINISLGHQRDSMKDDESIEKTNQINPKNSVIMSSNLRKRKSNGNADIHKRARPRAISVSMAPKPGLFDEILAVILTSWRMKWELLLTFGPFFIVLMAFAGFVIWNGGIVLGAKEAHVVSPHFAQIMYFGLVSALAVAPLHFNIIQARDLFRSFWKNRPNSLLLCVIALIAGFLAVHFFSIAHPYLLADNRHYTFYLWRKVINADQSRKYLFVPLYVYSWFSILNLLGKTRRKVWVLVFFLANVAVLVPAPLIEFRYYTIPFFLSVLHYDINSYRSWLLIGILYIVVNAFTMMMFLYRPFHWSHELGVQRFIW